MTSEPDLAPLVEDLELAGRAPQVVILDAVDAPRLAQAAAAGPVLSVLAGRLPDSALSALRDACWPAGHVTAIYRLDQNGVATREALAGRAVLPERVSGPERTVLYVRPRTDALSRATTVAKFDANAEGWNGDPRSPSYGHFRWMRRLVAEVARPQLGQRVLDAGCGAGWVGIEAALHGGMASAFDPSPAMVELARRNAVASGVDLDARVGFVEDVPFAQPFAIVLNSGVLSFAPDPEVFLAGLDQLVEPGGLLVLGDLNPLSRGFRRRRRRPLLPARELNALPRSRVESMLSDLGYRLEGHWYYQLSFPLPEMMALSEQRLAGIGSRAALLLNRAATAIDHAAGSRLLHQFDSWIVRARKPT